MQVLSEQSLLVKPNIEQLNRFAQRVKQVAITSVNPVFSPSQAEDHRRNLMALRIQVEGPSRSLQAFTRLLDGADFRI